MENYFEYKGIVEGFYGREWSHGERKDIISFMGKKGYNLYIYAPKTDPFHRVRWKDPYPYGYDKEFAELINLAAKNHVEFSAAVSPGLSLIYSHDEDLEKLFEKYTFFSNLGVKKFSLFFDDIPLSLNHMADKEKYSSLARAQSDFSNRLYDMLLKKDQDAKLIICPTLYHGTDPVQYHTLLGECLDLRIDIMWTGEDVCSQKLLTENTKKISHAFRRKVLYWDNFPVNDSLMCGELHIGPYESREKDLYLYSKGIVLNPMNQAYASMLVMADAINYMNFPDSYDPVKSKELSLKELYPDAYNGLLTLVHFNLKSPLHPQGFEKIKELALAFESEYSLRPVQAVEKYTILIEKHIQNLTSLEKTDEKLWKDILPWVEELSAKLRIMLETFELIKLSSDIQCEFPSKTDIQKAEEKVLYLERKISESIGFQTFSGGIDFLGFCLKYLLQAKSLLKLTQY